MAEVELKTWAGGAITPQLDAIIYDQITKSGISMGCEATLTGANGIHIAAGFGIIRGRQFVVNEHVQQIALPESGTLYGRIYFLLDLSNTEDPLRIIAETSERQFAALPTDETINYTNGTEGMELCTFTVKQERIEDLKNTFPKVTNLVEESDKIILGMENEKISFNEDGSITDKKSTITIHTEFLDDGSIMETYTDAEGNTTKILTEFLTDGSIQRTIKED